MKTHLWSFLSGAALSLCLSGPVMAQTVESASAASEENDVIQLSPFEVNAAEDNGYIATGTLAGSRLNTRLNDTPASISVMTTEFLNDIGATNVSEAIDYGLSAGNDIGGGGTQLGATTGNGLVGNEFNFQIRGYRNVALTRDYFPTTLSADAFNIQRIEVARGPNSLIFGVGGPGGIVNTAPKNAVLNRDFTSIELRGGSYDERRVNFDANQSMLDDKLAVRVNGLFQRKDGWKDFARDDQDRGAVALAYQVAPATKIRINTEFGSLEQNRVRSWNLVDQITSWQGQGSFYIPFGTAEAPWLPGDATYSQTRHGYTNPSNGFDADVPSGQTFERRTAHLGTPTIFLTDGPLAGKQVWVGTRGEGQRYYRTSFNNGPAGFNTPIFMDDENLSPRTANPVGPGAVHTTHYSVLGATVDQRIGEHLNLNLTASQTDANRRNNSPMGFASITYKLDVTTELPSFTTDGAYNGTQVTTAEEADATGKGIGALILNQSVVNPYVGKPIVNYTPTYNLVDESQKDVRLSASYHLDLKRVGDHTLLGFASRSQTEDETQSFQETNISPNRAVTRTWFNSANFGGRSSHVDYFAAALSERGVPDPYTNPLPSGNYYGNNTTYSFEDGWIRNNWRAAKTTIDSYAVALQSYFFDRDLITTIGGRRDKVKIVNRARDADSLGEAIGLGDATDPQEETGDTFSIGAVYHLPFVKGVSVFANKSTNFQPQGGAQRFEDADLRPNLEIGALKGTGYDYGLKFSLLDDRLYATVSYFDVSQANASAGYDGNFVSNINAIWTAIRNGGPDGNETDQGSTDGHRIGGNETRDQSADGWEFELTANPTEQWSISLNISKSDNVVANLGNNIGAYIDKHRAEWEQNSNLEYNTSAAPGYVPSDDTIYTIGDLVNNLDNLLTVLKAGEGVSEVNSRPVSANVFTRYRFTEGVLKGLTIGGGVNYRGDQILGVNPVTATNPDLQVFEGSKYYVGNAMLAYEFKMHDTRVHLQLNVDNLFDNADKQVLASSYNTATAQLEKFYYYLEPRRYSLTARFTF